MNAVASLRRVHEEARARADPDSPQSVLLRPFVARRLRRARAPDFERAPGLVRCSRCGARCSSRNAPATADRCAVAWSSRAGRCSTRKICGTACRRSPPATNGSRRRPPPAAPAACRCSVLRSLEAIVFEQATIDRVIQSVGVDARTARTAVLRGDNPRDIVVSPNPDCEVIGNGRIMTMSANAVTHTSVEHIANSLETFAPALLCAYPSALETLARYLRDSGRRLSIPSVVTSSEVFRPDAWTAGRTDVRMPAGGLLRPGGAHRVRLCECAAAISFRTRLFARRVHSLRRSSDPGRRQASACTKSSARRSGTACCPSCDTAPATWCGCRRAGANANCWKLSLGLAHV